MAPFYYIDDGKYEAALKKRPKRKSYGKRHHYYFAVLRWRLRVFIAYLGSDRGL